MLSFTCEGKEIMKEIRGGKIMSSLHTDGLKRKTLVTIIIANISIALFMCLVLDVFTCSNSLNPDDNSIS